MHKGESKVMQHTEADRENLQAAANINVPAFNFLSRLTNL